MGDVATAFTKLGTSLTTLSANAATYLQTRTNYASILQQNNVVTAANAKLELELRELNRQEEALNKQFLDIREQKKPSTAFSRMGLATIQDWSLAAFFASFLLLGMSILAQASRLSKYPVRVFLVGLPILAIVCGMFGLFIRVFG